MDPLASLIGQSSGMVAIHAQVRRLLSLITTARRVPPVLLRGETGTGKGHLARSLHAASSRAKAPFVSVNCAAIPETLLEAELFGFERGAFTDARQPKAGLFQEARGGTLFLDEIGLLPDSLQAKLLTALDERAVRRLGSIRNEPTDCWIVAATSADLEQARRERRFREDLYHRLSVFTISLPPLRERGDDVLRLAETLLERVCADYGLPPRTLDGGARSALERHRWPGNVRELGNVLERAALLSERPLISADTLGLPSDEHPRKEVQVDAPQVSMTLRGSLDGLERSTLLDVLERSHWNVALAAEMLGVPRNTLRYRIAKHGLVRPDRPVPRSTLRERVGQHGVASEGQGITAHSTRSSPRDSTALTNSTLSTRRAIAFLRISMTGVPPSASAITRALSLIVEKAETFGGRILRHGDDEMDAAFGLVPTEDAAARAAFAALSIRRLIQHAGKEHSGIQTRFGIEMLSCVIVRSARGEARLTQESMQRAREALRALIGPGELGIVVGPGAVPYLDRQFVLASGGSQADQRAIVHQRREWSDFGGDPSSSPRQSPFIGRTEELTLLDQRLRQVRTTGRGHIVALMGEAGIGKSRLLRELRRVVAGQGARLLEAQCASHAATSPYSLLIDFLQRAWRLEDLDGPAALRSAVTRHLGTLDLLDCKPEIYALLGLPVNRTAPLDPGATKERILEASRRLLLAHAGPGPLVLLVEDLHWADQTSQEFLGVLVEKLPGAPVLVVATTRPGYRGNWLGRSWAAQLALPPLSLDESLEIVRGVRPELDAAWADAIARRAEGNPFFLEELAWSVDTSEGRDARLPGTVHDVLSARIDRLPMGSQRILEAASVLGREAPLHLLEALTDARDTLQRNLEPLVAQEFLHEHRGTRGPIYAFKHALTQEVAYDRLGLPERQRLHALAGREIERLHAGSLDTVLAELAHHAVHAESWERAYTYLHAGALQALGASAFFEAAQLLRQALDALHKLPPSVQRDAQEFQTSLELWTACFESGQYEEVLGLEQQLKPLGQALGQRPQLAELIVRRAQLLWGRAKPREVIAAVPEVLRLTAPDALRTRSYACFLAGSASRDLGCVPEALEWFGTGRRLLETIPRDHPDAPVIFPILVNIHAWQSELYAILGRHEDACTVARKAVALARSIANPSALVFGEAFLGQALLLRGQLDQALPLLEQAFAALASGHFTNAISFAAVFLAYALALDGQPARALQLLDDHFPVPPSRTGSPQRTRYRSVTAAARLAAGRPDQALRELDFILPIARHTDLRGHLPTLLRLRAEALLRDPSTSLEEIHSLCEEARAMAAQVGLEPEIARCEGILGLAQVRAGKIESGRAHLTAAFEAFERLGMEYWMRRLMVEAANA
jgi:DNA-binding NtrC family response regulator/tetratricopeptide (TPR) repeat protein